MAFKNAIEKASSQQPHIDADATLSQNVKNARDFTIEKLTEYFESEFMSIGDGIEP